MLACKQALPLKMARGRNVGAWFQAPIFQAGYGHVESVPTLNYPSVLGGVVASWLVLDSGSSVPGSGPGRRHCIVFLGKTLFSHGAWG